MRDRIHHIVKFTACLLWLAAGVGILGVLLPRLARPTPHDIMLALGCTLLGLVFSSMRREFRVGEQHLIQAPDGGFLVLAAITLAPPVSVLVGSCAILWSVRRTSTVLQGAILLAGGAIATGIGSTVAHGVVSGRPSGREVLIAAAAAAVVRAVILMAGQLLLAESRARGGARTVFRGSPAPMILALDAGMPIAAVCLAGPFLSDPPLALLVVLAGQLLAWTVLGVLHKNHRGAHITSELLTTFHRYVPRHVANEVLARQGGGTGATMAGELREITVMFLDIQGFSGWSERTAPAEVLLELNRLLGDLSDAILAADGTLDKFTGDGLMAMWNAPHDQPDHAALALGALPRLLMRVREHNIRREAQRAVPLEIGIGISTGPAVVGNVGHRDRLSYTAIGDTVNLAARLESATRSIGVPAVVDERTFLALPTSMQRQLTRLASIEVKGRTERVRPYAPTALLRHRDGRGAA